MYFKQAIDGDNEWWKYALTVVILILGYGLGQLPLTLVQSNAIEKYSDIGTDDLESFASNMDFSIFHMSNNFGISLLFLIFVFATICFLLAVHFLHGKSLKGLITHRSRINWPKIWFGLIVWMVFMFILEGVNYTMNPDSYYLNVDWGKFFWLVLICVTLLPIQTTLEELFFRSYLMKGIGLLSRNKWVPLIITTILFGLVHGTNPEVTKYGIVPMQFYYLSAGLILGVMTIMDDGLELAIGVHAATNMYGALFFCYEGSVLQTDSIWRLTDINPWIMAGSFVIAGIVFLLLAQKMFDWPAWSKIWEDIDLSDEA